MITSFLLAELNEVTQKQRDIWAHAMQGATCIFWKIPVFCNSFNKTGTCAWHFVYQVCLLSSVTQHPFLLNQGRAFRAWYLCHIQNVIYLVCLSLSLLPWLDLMTWL